MFKSLGLDSFRSTPPSISSCRVVSTYINIYIICSSCGRIGFVCFVSIFPQRKKSDEGSPNRSKTVAGPPIERERCRAMSGNARTDASHTAAGSRPTYDQTRGRPSSVHARPTTPPHVDVRSASAAVDGVLAVQAQALQADSAVS